MDRQLLERMIGASVLVIVLIIIVPAVLTGPEQVVVDDINPTADVDGLRQVTIRPDGATESPPVAQPLDAEPVVAAEDAPPPVVVSPDASAAADAVAEPEPAVKPAPKPKPEPAPAPKPKPKPKPAPEPVAQLKAGWVVQLGSFSSKPNAEALAARAEKAGFDSYLVPLVRDGKTLYRVRVGPPAEQREQADRLAAKLKSAGYKGQVARQEAGG